MANERDPLRKIGDKKTSPINNNIVWFLLVLGVLTLLAVSVWLTRTGRNALFAIIPMIFMMCMTLWSLVLQIKPFVQALPAWIDGTAPKGQVITGGIVGVVLFILSLWLIVEAVRVLRHGAKLPPETELTESAA